MCIITSSSVRIRTGKNYLKEIYEITSHIDRCEDKYWEKVPQGNLRNNIKLRQGLFLH